MKLPLAGAIMKEMTMIQVRSLFSDFGCIVDGKFNSNLFTFELDEIRDLYRRHAVVFFRGFDVSIEDFKKFSDQCCSQYISHSYALTRKKFQQFAGDTTITQVTVGQNDLALHGEMYHSPDHPEVVWFYCQSPAAVGGETTLADANRLFVELPAPLQKLFESKRLRYKHCDPKAAWEVRYGTDDINEVMALLKTRSGIENVSTDDQETLIFDYVTTAIHQSKYHEKRVFVGNLFINKNPANRPDFDLKKFHSLPSAVDTALPKRRVIEVEFEDGTEIPDAVLQEIHEIASRITFDLKWQKNDFVMVDNTRLLHGRRAFQGQRVIATRLASAA
jgi:alpha-ketoglutarate-dependent taurine dioxygenase